MQGPQARALRYISLFLLLLGFAGILIDASISTKYLRNPRVPVPEEGRFIPRAIHGTVVFQTRAEDRRLTIVEDGSVAVFLVGIAIGLLCLRKWGIEYALSTVDEDTIES